MDRRLQLQTLLEQILGSRNVYFQPPNNITIKYPAIVYKRDRARTRFADNLPYRRAKQYSVTVIDRNPDSEIPDRVAELEYCSHSTFFVVDGLNHDVFNLYF